MSENRYVIRETDSDGHNEKIVMDTLDVNEARGYFGDGWTLVMSNLALGVDVYHHRDGRSAGLSHLG